MSSAIWESFCLRLNVLTLKSLETYCGYCFSTRPSVSTVLTKHLLYLDQFHAKLLHVQCTILETKITFGKQQQQKPGAVVKVPHFTLNIIAQACIYYNLPLKSSTRHNSNFPWPLSCCSYSGSMTYITGPLWGESTSNWWIPLTKG